MFVFRYTRCVGAVVLLSNLNDLKLKKTNVFCFFFAIGFWGANTHNIYSSLVDLKAFVAQAKTVVYCPPEEKINT